MTAFTLTARSERLLGLGELLEHIAQKTSSPSAAILAQKPHFFDDIDAAREQLLRIEEAQALLEGEDGLRCSPLFEVSQILVRAERGAALELEELAAILALARECARHRRWAAASRARAPQLWLYLAALPQLDEISDVLGDALTEQNELRDDASAALSRARQKVRSLKTNLREQADAMMQSEEVLPLLMDNFVSVRNGRFVLPVNASYQAKVPGIVHNASQTGQTLFVEPLALIARGNELTIAEAEAETAEIEARRMLAGEVAQHAQALSQAYSLLIKLDVLVASAQVSRELSLVAPKLSKNTMGPPHATPDGNLRAGAPNRTLSLPGVTHPRLLRGTKPVVRSDVVLRGPGQIMLISGPNAGGKTVLLASVALALSMARMGLPLATSKAADVPWLDAISCAWGDGQSLVRGVSSFAAQLEALVQMTEEARPNALMIIDELGGDTDPSEGAALAQAVLEHLAERGVWALVTTHLDALRALPLTDTRFVTARMATHTDGVTPAYRLEQGASGSSLALKLAERAGLRPSVLKRAQALRAEGGLLTQALEELEAQRLALNAEQEGLIEAKERAEHEAKAQLERQREQARLAQKNTEAAFLAYRDELRQKAAALGELIEELRNRGERPAAQRALATLERELSSTMPAPQIEPPTEAPKGVEAGQMVRVRPLGQICEVLAVDYEAGFAELKLGAMRTRVRLGNIEPVSAAKLRTPDIKVQVQADQASQTRSEGALPGRCDVRGLRQHEALSRLARSLDHCLAEGVAMLLVVHGHGPLRDEIRRELGRSLYVAHARPGDSHEGGDGVTLVELDRS